MATSPLWSVIRRQGKIVRGGVRATRLIASVGAITSASAGIVLAAAPSAFGEALVLVSPWTLILALLVLGCSALTRAPLLVLALAALGVAAPAFVVAPEVTAALRPPAQVSESTPRLKIVSVNLWTENDDALAFGRFIRAEEPHIILVQEAFGHWDDVLNALPAEYRIQAGCQHGSDCNVAAVSRLREVDDLLRTTHRMTGVRLQLPESLGGEPIEVVSVHLDRGIEGGRAAEQLNEVGEMARLLGPRAIVGGDFNATPWTRTLRELDATIPLERRTRALFTWPTPSRAMTRHRFRSPLPLVPIDHIYAGEAWRVLEVRRGPDIGSDHYPVVVTLTPAELVRPRT